MAALSNTAAGPASNPPKKEKKRKKKKEKTKNKKKKEKGLVFLFLCLVFGWYLISLVLVICFDLFFGGRQGAKPTWVMPPTPSSWILLLFRLIFNFRFSSASVGLVGI